MLKLCKLSTSPNGTLGLHLNRAPWDPYPWVSGIQANSSAQRAGLRDGDTVLKINGRDVLGQRIVEIAHDIDEHRKSGASYLCIVIWRHQVEGVAERDGVSDCGTERSAENATTQQQLKQTQQQQHQQQQQPHRQHSINQQSLQKFASCLQHIAQLLECPVCLEVIRPPGWQCCNGHVFCHSCRNRSVKCPVCRVALGPRGRCLLSDQLYALLAESFPCDGFKINQNHSNSNSDTNNNNDTNNPHYKKTGRKGLRNQMPTFNNRPRASIAAEAAKVAEK